MTDLISRQDAIALLEAEKVNATETEDATDEAYNMAIVHCIKALTNMPSAKTIEEWKNAENPYKGSDTLGGNVFTPNAFGRQP